MKSKSLSTMEGVEMRALEDQAERLGFAASSRSVQPLNIREELTQAEARASKVWVRLDPRHPSESEV